MRQSLLLREARLSSIAETAGSSVTGAPSAVGGGADALEGARRESAARCSRWPTSTSTRSFAVPVLAWAVDAFDSRSDRQLVAASAALLLIREHMGAVVLILGLLRVARRPRIVGVLLACSGAAAFVVVVGVVIPSIGGRGYAYWDYGALGADGSEVVRTMLGQPWIAIGLFFTPIVKTMTLLGLLSPLLLLPLLSPVSLLALPLLVERFLSGGLRTSSSWT